MVFFCFSEALQHRSKSSIVALLLVSMIPLFMTTIVFVITRETDPH